MKLLLRSGKDPFTAMSAEESFFFYPGKGVFGTNVGNLVFSDSMHKIISTPSSNVVSNSLLTERPGVDAGYAQRVNEEFDAFVVPLANAFRPKMADTLNRLSVVVEKLTIPVVVAGVGVQRSIAAPSESMSPETNEAIKRFMNAVLDRSARVGVRGEVTRAYLKQLGYGDDHIAVIGCPSLFAEGHDHRVVTTGEGLNDSSLVSMNVSPYVKDMAKFVASHHRKYENLVYIPQVFNDLEAIMWGKAPKKISDRNTPNYPTHPLFLEDKVKFFLDSRTWVDFLRTRDFSFGTRIHGNIAALKAGTPAMVLVHDTRTLELAEYHQIPHRFINSLPENTTATELYDQADYTAFNAGFSQRLTTFCDFLDENQIPHIYTPGNENPDYQKSLERVSLPGPVTPVTAFTPQGHQSLVSRMTWLYSKSPQPKVYPYQVSAPFPAAVKKEQKTVPPTQQVPTPQPRRPLWKRAARSVKKSLTS